MLNHIISFSIKNKLIIGLFIIGLIGYGSYQFTKLPIDAVPDITDNQVQVITTAPSLGAPDIERLITFPIEQANSNIPGIKEIRSFSRFGLSLITIVFEDDVDIYWARQQVSERLTQAQSQIPKSLGTPVLAPVTSGLGEIYQFVIRAKGVYKLKYDATELRTMQDWVVRRQLLGVKGVADVSSFGGKLKQFEIAVDANKLQALNITINDIFTAVENNNENTGGAYIERKSTVMYIRSEGLIGNIDDIKNIVVKNTSEGIPILINDVAEVKIGNAIRYGAMTYNDEGECVGAVVMMLKGENSNEVIKNVKDRITQIQKTLPKGIVIEPFLDRTKMVNSAIGTVENNLMEGALIVIFVLVLFLGNFRAGLLVASVIPLALLFAVIMMNLFGVSGNLMSLGALDFGLIVDGAVIIVEAVMHSLVHSKKTNAIGGIGQNEMDTTVKRSASRMMNSAVFGQIIILVVYLPIFALEGIEGKMFKPMAQTVAFALLGAFLLSLTYIPMMSALFLSKNSAYKKNLSDRMMEFFIRIHQNTLGKALKYPKTILSIAMSFMAISFFVFSRMGGEFIPELPEGDFAVETRLLTGSNIHTTVDACLKSAHILKKFPEVKKVVGKIGSGEIPTDPMPMEAADLIVVLKDKSEWTTASSYNQLSEKMAKALEDVPGIQYGFQYPVAMRFNELMTGSKQDVVCKIFGENLDTLAKYSKQLGTVAQKIKGAQEIYVETVNGLPQLIIKYRQSAIAQYGLNISDINRVVNIAFAGQSSGQVFEDEKRFDLVVRLAGDKRQKLEDVQNLLIPTPSGIQVPLHQVADVSLKESVNQIQREDAKRRIVVGFNVKDRDVQSIVKDLQTNVNKEIKLPAGYYVTYGGAFENLEVAKKRLSIAVPLSLLLIFLFLYFAFGSIQQGLLIYSAIPLSTIGGILFLSLRGMPFSISAGIGFIALFGVAVLNGIVLIAEFNRLRDEGETDSKNIVLLGTKHRLRPVLMTAFVASLGFLPMALSQGAGAEVQRPLATVVIGGLLTATFLTLIVLPILYVLLDKLGKKKTSNKTSIPTLMVILIFTFHNVNAQPEITLKAALDSALQNNLSIRNAKLEAEIQKNMMGATLDLPQTNVSFEYGQINSFYNDTKFGISQSLNFPTVYKRQKLIQKETFTNALLIMGKKEAELKREVTLTFYQLRYLQEKLRILSKIDSLYSSFLDKINLRYAKGETNAIEKITAETQLGEITSQQKLLKADIESLILQFQWLLNTQKKYLPYPKEPNLVFIEILDTTALRKHPEIKTLEQENKLSLENTALEKSKLLPTLNLGYGNQSMLGVGANNQLYSSSTRFHSLQFGIGVPLFFKPQRSRIQVSNVAQLISQNNYLLGIGKIQSEWESNQMKYKAQRTNVAYYEEIALKNAALITKIADLQFSNGDINYLEWTQLINQNISIQSNYANAIYNLNTTIIQLNYLTNP